MILLGLLGEDLKACWLLNTDGPVLTDSQTLWSDLGVAGSHWLPRAVLVSFSCALALRAEFMLPKLLIEENAAVCEQLSHSKDGAGFSMQHLGRCVGGAALCSGTRAAPGSQGESGWTNLLCFAECFQHPSLVWL